MVGVQRPSSGAGNQAGVSGRMKPDEAAMGPNFTGVGMAEKKPLKEVLDRLSITGDEPGGIGATSWF